MISLFAYWTSQINLQSGNIKSLWVSSNLKGLMNTPRVDTKISRVHGGHRRGVKVHGTKIINILRKGCKACQILPWVRKKEQKINHMKFIPCFVLEIEVKISKNY